LSINPTSVDFAPVAVGGTSNQVLLTVSNNTGNVSLSPVDLALSGSNASDFTISANTCTSQSLGSGSMSCLVGITFAPLSAGPKSATLTVTAGTETASVSLSALQSS
jgi:hypothetical protein